MMSASSPQEIALITQQSYIDINTPFRQQSGEFWRPKMTRVKSMALCSILGVILLIVGGGMYAAVDMIVQTDVVHYHQFPVGTATSIDIPITKKMAAPIYVYYRIDNFFQNHRRYVISRDERQLRGLDIDSSTLTCAPLKTFGDLASHKDRSFMRDPPAGSPADINSHILYPCGLAAVTAFSDVLTGCVKRGGVAPCNALSGSAWSNAEIAYPSDANKFKFVSTFDTNTMTTANPYNSSRPNGQLLRLEDPDLTVWMRHAATSSFHKLYRVITDTDLEEGDVLQVDIENNWEVNAFEGKKGVVLATKSVLGGKSFTLPIIWMVTGAACLFEAVFVFVLTRWCDGYVPVDGK